jgi:hypothetical protein
MLETNKGKQARALPELRCCDVGHDAMVLLSHVGQTKHWVIVVHLRQHNNRQEVYELHLPLCLIIPVLLLHLNARTALGVARVHVHLEKVVEFNRLVGVFWSNWNFVTMLPWNFCLYIRVVYFSECAAFLPELWMSGHHAGIVLSAIEPTSFLQVLETSPCRGGSAEILYLQCCFNTCKY